MALAQVEADVGGSFVGIGDRCTRCNTTPGSDGAPDRSELRVSRPAIDRNDNEMGRYGTF